MKVAIAEKNIEKIGKVVTQVNGKATVRLLTVDDIFKVAKDAESYLWDKLTKSERKGVKLTFGYYDYSDFAKAYFRKATPTGTVITIERGAKDWFLVEIERKKCIGRNRFTFSDEQKKQIAINAVNNAIYFS